MSTSTKSKHTFNGGKCERCFVREEIAAPQCVLFCHCPDQCPIHDCRCPDQCPIHVDVKAVMLHALEHIMEYFDNPEVDVPEIEDFMADQVFAEAEAAIKLAKGEQS